VILGGLVTTTAVSLFVLPALYLRFGGRQPTLSPEEELMHRWAGIEPAPAGATAADGDVAEPRREPITGTAATTEPAKDGGGDSGERQSAV
jgi:hypothetical protein